MLVIAFNMVIRPISFFFNLVLCFGRFLPIFADFSCSQGEKVTEEIVGGQHVTMTQLLCEFSVPLLNTMETTLPVGKATETRLHLLPSHPSRNDKYLTSKSGKIC